MDFWSFFTRLADTNFTLPVALLISVWLAAAREWRLATWWLMLFGFGLFLVTATKVAYVGWGIGIAAVDFHGFSGHAMRAATIAPPFAYLLAQRCTSSVRATAVIAAIVFAIAICVSRLVLGVHSVSEAISGLLLGFLLAFTFIAISQRHAGIAFTRQYLILGALLLLPILNARPAPTQGWIEHVATHLAGEANRDAILQRMGKLPPNDTPDTAIQR
ncbi:phosphatase PAP2 family protein [uncultured Oxalicibacterium sp.]|uniref:phosphatase PAP2 family protein n=1 Tax=uncultured Oxalicibacterium sp. TaxID=1168540 RepID=UPI0025E19962|nr:phosphatase PAP2 family protein [uncultured Oxalicibacterium sp.]